MRHQAADVLAPLAQRGQPDGDDVEPVKQIAAKAAVGHLGFQVAVGGHHNAHVDLDFALAAQPYHGAFLQGAQELGLHGQRQVTNFVQKNGALVRLLKPAGPLGGGAGERPALVAKQLGLKQRVWNGGAIDLDEGRMAALAGQMQGAGKQLLARARLAQQQHAGLGVGHALQLANGLQQHIRVANDAVAHGRRVERVGQQGVARFQRARFLLHQVLQLQNLPCQRGQNF